MKRDDELIRAVLLRVEAEGRGPGCPIEDFSIGSEDKRKVNYHVWLLYTGAYLDAVKTLEVDPVDEEVFHLYQPCCLTASGHDFLSSIRDTEIWRQTKDAAQKGGAATLDLLKVLALAFVKKQVQDRTGLVLD